MSRRNLKGLLDGGERGFWASELEIGGSFFRTWATYSTMRRLMTKKIYPHGSTCQRRFG